MRVSEAGVEERGRRAARGFMRFFRCLIPLWEEVVCSERSCDVGLRQVKVKVNAGRPSVPRS